MYAHIHGHYHVSMHDSSTETNREASEGASLVFLAEQSFIDTVILRNCVARLVVQLVSDKVKGESLGQYLLGT